MVATLVMLRRASSAAFLAKGVKLDEHATKMTLQLHSLRVIASSIYLIQKLGAAHI